VKPFAALVTVAGYSSYLVWFFYQALEFLEVFVAGFTFNQRLQRPIL
jgi:hypothetical protein